MDDLESAPGAAPGLRGIAKLRLLPNGSRMSDGAVGCPGGHMDGVVEHASWRSLEDAKCPSKIIHTFVESQITPGTQVEFPFVFR